MSILHISAIVILIVIILLAVGITKKNKKIIFTGVILGIIFAASLFALIGFVKDVV